MANKPAPNKILAFPTPNTADADARTTALDIQASFIVEAPAGSGKTGLLVQRYLKLLLDPNLESPEEVLAITFTNKATAELLQRVLEELQAAKSAEPVPDDNPFKLLTRDLAAGVLARDAQLDWHLLASPQRLNIRSIDSVCAGIANSVPILANSGGPRNLLQDARPLYNAAARRTLLQLGGSDARLHTALRNVLLHRDGNLQNTEALLASMLANREQWGELVPLDTATLTDELLDTAVRPRLEKTLEDIVCAGLTQALRLMPETALLELSSYGANWSTYPGYKGKLNPLAICANLTGPPAAKAEALDHWHALINLVLKSDGDWRASRQAFQNNYLGIDLPKGESARLQQFVEEIESERLKEALCAIRGLPPARYPEDQWAVAKSLFLVLRHALAELQILFAERAECDFAELSLAAREALRSDSSVSDVALSAGGRLRHLLVDEMQDTSTGQYELLELLTKSWDGHTQTLFLVGDPKQSIYAFRKAEVARFLRTMREESLADLPLQALRLNMNFRSQADLVRDFNQIFLPLFPGPDDEALRNASTADVPYVKATAARSATLSEALHWHTTILSKSPDNTRTTVANHHVTEAREIRSIIADWRAKPLPADHVRPWRIAVLASTRRQLATIASELKSATIPYRAVEVESLAERQEVLDCLALTRALLHPADRIAWLAVLHAPWCGLSLADLLALTGEGATADLTAAIAELLARHIDAISPEGQALLTRAWPVLATAVETLGRTSLAIHAERTWRSLGGDAALTPESRLNAIRFFATLRDVENLGQGRIDLATLTTRIADLYAEPGGTDDDVQLMTIHKAKGLEWDVVLVPGLERRPAGNRSELLNWLEFDSAESTQFILAPIAGKGEASTALYKWLSQVRAARDAAERKRVFYVACTRAREELHLFAAVERKQDGQLAKPPTGSLLAACWPAAAVHFETLAPASIPVVQLPAIEYEPLALAASVDSHDEPRPEPQPQPRPAPILHRLPLDFHPRARFTSAPRLPYALAETLPHAATFDRPEGSFAARAFGNVVHRYLQLLCDQIAAGQTLDPATWRPRLLTSLRGEGLPPTLATREADRALLALTQTLSDETGRWLLAAHPSGTTESSLATADRTVRADRTFLAGDAPLLTGTTTLWIIDFKTTEQGSRTDDAFASDELAKYRTQLESYAVLLSQQPSTPQAIRLGLFYPLKPRLIQWQYATPAAP